MPPPAPPRLLPKGLDWFSQKVLDLLVSQALLGGLLEKSDWTLAGKELSEHGVQYDAGDSDADQDHTAVPRGLDVLLG